MLVSSIICALAVRSGKSVGCSCFWDPITITHVESVLKEHHAVAHAMMMSAGVLIVQIQGFSNSNEDLERILRAETPGSEFDLLQISGLETNFGKGAKSLSVACPENHWVHLNVSQLQGLEASPFSIRSVSKLISKKPTAIGDCSYRKRRYLGPDLKRHIGYDLHFWSKGGSVKTSINPDQQYTIMDNRTLPTVMRDTVNRTYKQVLLTFG